MATSDTSKSSSTDTSKISLKEKSSTKKYSKLAYRPEYRLKKKSDFAKMEKANILLHTRPFTIILSPSDTTETRLGIVVTKKVDKRAVVRNKIKRRAREIFRVYRSTFKAPYDVLFIARRSAPTCSFETMRKQVIAALWQHGFLKDKEPKKGSSDDGVL